MPAGIHTFFLGLGFFFVGLLMTGDRMRLIAGRSFYKAASKVESPLFAATVGTGFGALMQSATAVTFILVSMVRSGLMTAPVTLPIILWANVGLTALSFVATFNIHTAVAWMVGLSGTALGLLKVQVLRPWLGLVFGISVILFGLQMMGESASLLKDQPFFQHIIEMTAASPTKAFLVGMVAAAVLQSNVGTVLLTTTLACAGAFSLETSAMIIYGSNLGAIFLRLFLSIGMDRASYRLVRFEDFFCLWSGGVMIALYALEAAGLPLVLALARQLSPNANIQLAGIFFLSNFIPALLLHPWRNKALAFLAKIWPGESPEDHARPKFINHTALDHPPTAVGLAQKELGRLLGKIHAQSDAPRRGNEMEEFQPAEDFTKLSIAIDQFLAEIISKSDLHRDAARAVQLQRAELSMIRYLAESIGQFSQSATQVMAVPGLVDPAMRMVERVNTVLSLAASATDNMKAEVITALFQESAKKNPANLSLRDALRSPTSAMESDLAPSAEAVRENFSTSLWILHRLSKVLRRGGEEVAKL